MQVVQEEVALLADSCSVPTTGTHVKGINHLVWSVHKGQQQRESQEGGREREKRGMSEEGCVEERKGVVERRRGARETK